MTRTTIREKNLQVVAEDDGSIQIGKCEEFDNFDEHGSDWDLPLDGPEEARKLAAMLVKAADAAAAFLAES